MAQHSTTATTDPVEALVAAIGRLGQATPAEIAADAGVAYSTTNKKLRDLAAAGRAEKFTTEDNRTLWRLTGPDTGDATAADQPDSDGPDFDGPDTEIIDAGTDQPDDGGQPPVAVSPDEPDPDPATATAAPHPTEQIEPTELDVGVDGHVTDLDAIADGGPEPSAADETRIPASSGAEGERTAGADAPATTAQPEPAGPAKPRRASGTLDGAVLDILEPHPDRGFKVSELCKLIDQANQGSDAAKASPGAVVLACQRLVRKGKAVLVVEKPATFQLTRTGD
jgi:hypothetical protein